MLLIPLRTRLLKLGDDLAKVLWGAGEFQTGDILVVSSKAVATVEGAAIELSNIVPSLAARRWARKTGGSPGFCEAVLQEVHRLRGRVVGSCPGALLTELRPKGLTHGTILTANAGMDESNAPKGFAIGWPRDPVRSVRRLREELECHAEEARFDGFEAASQHLTMTKQAVSKHRLAMILSDSCCRPQRKGVTAHALTVSGMNPFESQVGKADLFGRKLRITVEAVADQLATAANVLMGNAGQGIPAVIIRDHGLTLSNCEGWVPGIDEKEDLFRRIM